MGRGRANGRQLVTAMGVCAGLLLGFAPAASGATTFQGPTSQGETFKLTVDRDGVPSKASYNWDMECSGGGTLSNGGTLSSRFSNANARGFKSSGMYEADIERKFEADIRVRLEGERASDTRFTGTFKLRAKVYRKGSGELLTRCSTGIVRWTADLKGPAPAPEPPPTPRLRLG